jgi:hypothetical protein
MRCARARKEIEANPQRIADLTLTAAIGLLAPPTIIVNPTVEPRETILVKATVFEPPRETILVKVKVFEPPREPAQQVTWDDYAEVEMIMDYIRQLASSKEKYAVAGDVAFIVDRMSADQQAEVVKQLADIQSLAVLFTEAIKQAAAMRSGSNVLTSRQ